MRVAFVIPSLHTRERDWWRFPQIVKLAAPTLAGYLAKHGVTDLAHYDFEVQGFDALRRAPEAFRFDLLDDDARVDAFLARPDDPAVQPELRHLGETFLDTLGVQAADVFALSTASVIGRYADMHAAGNLCLVLATLLKQRYPGCRTVVGGLQISPESLHQDEYASMLARSPALDACAIGKGEGALLHLVRTWQGQPSPVAGEIDAVVAHGRPILRWKVGRAPVAPDEEIRRTEEEGALTEGRALPDEAPAGSHARRSLQNPSVRLTPWFDRRAVDARAVSSRALLARYHLDATWGERLGARDDDRVVVLPLIFQEGCNGSCAFCCYGISRMIRRDPADAVRVVAHLRERHDVRYFHFLNTNINGTYAYAERFIDELIAAKLDILWSDCANLRSVDEKLLVKARQSGAIRFSWGLEYPADRVLRYIHKGITIEKARQRLRLAHELGLWNQVLLITGIPTETDADLAEFVRFLEETAEFMDGYNVSPFYLINGSLMGLHPERYGIRPEPNERGLLEGAGFSEIGGRSWPEKLAAIRESTRVVTRTIQRVKRDPKYWSGSIDLDLLFLLYDRWGHARKADIVAAFEQGFLGAPASLGVFRPILDRLLRAPEGPTAPLAGTGWSADPDAVRLTPGAALALPLAGGTHRVTLEIRHHVRGALPALAGGAVIEVRASGRPSFSGALDALLEPGTPFRGAIARAGWKVVAADLGLDAHERGFRIARGDDVVDLVLAAGGPERPAALRRGDVGFSYRLPAASQDLFEREPVVGRFVMRMGRFLVDALAEAAGAGDVPFLDPDRQRALARALAEGLEAPIAADIAWEAAWYAAYPESLLSAEDSPDPPPESSTSA